MFYKTWLFVPAIEKYLKNVPAADVVIFDLEDSIRSEDKQAARRRLKVWLETYGHRNKREIFVRLNSGVEGIEDLNALRHCLFDGVMVPKFENTKTLQDLAPLLEVRKIIALIETIKGVVEVDQIAAEEKVNAIAFGGEDFCRELGVETNDQAMQYARGRIVLYSKYYNKYCLDTINMEFKDPDQFGKLFLNSINMGFDSKLLIHPSQVKVVESLDDQIDLKLISDIVSKYEDGDGGLAYINGRWYEKPHIERLKALLRKEGDKYNA